MVFLDDLAEGQNFEDEILAFVQIKYPMAYRISGSFSGYDIEVPEKGHKIECKFDRGSERTPNIVIEFEYQGRPSGIQATTATHWIYKFHHNNQWKLAIARVDVWREVCKDAPRTVKGGDGFQSNLYLIPKTLFLKRKGIKIRLVVDK
jgi:hypothetical protein